MVKPGKILITEKKISKKVKELGKKISRDYKGKDILIIGILKGSFIFISDLIRTIDLPARVEFMAVKSYKGTKTTGKVEILLDLRKDIKGKNVLIVEDIVDTGITLDAVRKILKSRRPKNLKICALLNNKWRRRVKVKLDYTGFTIPNKFVVGYGLDFEDNYRGLPYVAVIDKKSS